jgi:cytochrome c oxidase subunit 2
MGEFQRAAGAIAPVVCGAGYVNEFTGDEGRAMRFLRRALNMLMLAGLLSSCAGSPTFLSPASPVSGDEAGLYRVLVYMAAGVFVLVEGILIYSVVRFRRRGEDPVEPRQSYGNPRLEVIWTGTPVLLVATLFFLTIRTMGAVAAPAAASNDIQLKIIGHQWWWEFEYPDLGVVTANELHIPIGANVHATLESVDVIHSFWIPQLSGKVDVIPGQTNTIWFRSDQPGNYHGQCAEFCGLNHANMRIAAIVEPQADFDAWVANQQLPPPQPQGPAEQRAVDLITHGICSNCHALGQQPPPPPGEPAKKLIGPNLNHLMSRSVFAGATLELTPGNIKRWLQDTQQMKPGNDMIVKLKPDEIDDLMAYLTQLK